MTKTPDEFVNLALELAIKHRLTEHDPEGGKEKTYEVSPAGNGSLSSTECACEGAPSFHGKTLKMSLPEDELEGYFDHLVIGVEYLLESNHCSYDLSTAIKRANPRGVIAYHRGQGDGEPDFLIEVAVLFDLDQEAVIEVKSETDYQELKSLEDLPFEDTMKAFFAEVYKSRTDWLKEDF